MQKGMFHLYTNQRANENHLFSASIMRCRGDRRRFDHPARLFKHFIVVRVNVFKGYV